MQRSNEKKQVYINVYVIEYNRSFGSRREKRSPQTNLRFNRATVEDIFESADNCL